MEGRSTLDTSRIRGDKRVRGDKELLREMPNHPPGPDRLQPVTDLPETYAEQGIDLEQAHRLQGGALAAPGQVGRVRSANSLGSSSSSKGRSNLAPPRARGCLFYGHRKLGVVDARPASRIAPQLPAPAWGTGRQRVEGP